MWLLKTDTLELEEFYKDFPKYAILSHRWEDKQEVSFQNIGQSPTHLNGYHKVKRFCEVARSARFDYAWVDTCCIDKKSSAELSEAINSMYRWYEQAAICYVYLCDVDGDEDLPDSLWFTRGWTLQELLAPAKLHFFNRKWVCLASRKEFAVKLEDITGIPQVALDKFVPDSFCIATRMSWSAKRTTTREEDRAYCLLGIFKVNMPLLYGEGEKAFQRLQEEIMRSNTDLSILLWQGRACDSFGVMAADPSCFVTVPKCLNDPSIRAKFRSSTGWDINNAGIRMSAVVEPYALTNASGRIYVMFLYQHYNAPVFGIFIIKKTQTQNGIIYQRVACNGQTWVEANGELLVHHTYVDPAEPKQLTISREPIIERQAYRHCGINIVFESDVACRCTASQVPASKPYMSLKYWPLVADTSVGNLECSFTAEIVYGTGIIGILVVTIADEIDLLICLGFDQSFNSFYVAIPFCRRIYQEGLRPQNVERAYRTLLPSGSGRYKVVDDPASRIFALRGLCIAPSLVGGPQKALVTKMLWRKSGVCTMLINFDAGIFLKDSLPQLQYVDSRKHNGLRREAVLTLAKIGSALYEPQREILIGPRR